MDPALLASTLNTLSSTSTTDQSKVGTEESSENGNPKIMDARVVKNKLPLKEDIYSQVLNIQVISDRLIQYLGLDDLRRLGAALISSSECKPLFSSTREEVRNIVFTPVEIDGSLWEGNYAWYSFLVDDGSWETRGTPQPGMVEYTTECRDIDKVFSYQEGENEVENWIMFGELKDGSVYKFEGGCDYTGFDCIGGGELILAPGWRNLFDHLTACEIGSFIDNLNQGAVELKQALDDISDSKDLNEVLAQLFSDKIIPDCLQLR
ncbi:MULTISPECIES: hypothetical protein [unclassified Endozoicomonas]|uniref:hypothetical protein n=1 Tax=unclassified Endozoicomonas TaxID=2644528 RepID=UPI003BB63C68